MEAFCYVGYTGGVGGDLCESKDYIILNHFANVPLYLKYISVFQLLGWNCALNLGNNFFHSLGFMLAN